MIRFALTHPQRRTPDDQEESENDNYIRKHYLTLKSQGIDNASARLFSNPAGDFGSLVNDQVVEGNWDNDNELAKLMILAFGINCWARSLKGIDRSPLDQVRQLRSLLP